MKLLKPNTQSPEIREWKIFLTQLGLYYSTIDNHYSASFKPSVEAYQMRKQITIDGYIGNMTWHEAYLDGMEFSIGQKRAFPLKPSFVPITTQQKRFDTFGTIEYIPNPTSSDPDSITIINNFEKENIISVEIPQLAKIFEGRYRSMRFHKKGAQQLLDFFDAIEKRGLLSLILSYGGSYTPRLIRGSTTTLSNHAFGTAFDLNMEWNWLNTEPALLGTKGSLRELVPLAHQYGFYWGGHFSRKDGMHFELAKLL